MNKIVLLISFCFLISCNNTIPSASNNQRGLNNDIVPQGHYISKIWIKKNNERLRFFITGDTVSILKPVFLQIGRTFYVTDKKTMSKLHLEEITDIQELENNPNVYKLTYYPIHWMLVSKEKASSYLESHKNDKPVETIFASELWLSNEITVFNTKVDMLCFVICFQNYSYYSNLHYYSESDCSHSKLCPFRSVHLNEFIFYERVVAPINYHF